MQEQTFEDPVTSQKFHATDYEVKDNPSGRGRVLRTMAPSGAMAVKIHMAGMEDYGDDMDTSEVHEMDETSREVNDTADSMREEEGIASNPAFGLSRAVGGATQGIGGVGPMSWQALRLPSVSFGERKGVVSRIGNVLKSLGIDRSTFRRGPYANLITARMWTDYINNMDMQDVGAELSSDISPEERLSIFLFCKEWENDPSHVSFRSRLFNTPDVNSVDEMAKGNLVYDLSTGAIPGPGLPKNMSTVKHSKMFRLAFDIIHSMRLMNYNFYSLNTVHRDEGTAVYDEFVSNYVALEPDEVEILHEIRDGLSNHGQSYAFRTTSENGDPLGAFELMNRATAAYETGDTKLARSVLDTLFMHPYNYLPEVGYKGLFDATSSKFLGKQPHHLFINGAFRWILPTADIGSVKDDGRSFNLEVGKQIIEVLSYTHPKPIAVWTKGSGKKAWSVMPWEEFSRIGKQAKAFESRSPQESQQLRYAESAALSAGSKDKHGGHGRHEGKRSRERGRGKGGGHGGGRGGGKKFTAEETKAWKKRKAAEKANPAKKERDKEGRVLRYECPSCGWTGHDAYFGPPEGQFMPIDDRPFGRIDWTMHPRCPNCGEPVIDLTEQEQSNPRQNMAFDASAMRQTASAQAKDDMMNAFTKKYLDPTFTKQIEKGERPSVRLADILILEAGAAMTGYQEAERLALAYDPNATGHSAKSVVLEKVLSQAYKTAVKVTHSEQGTWRYNFTMGRTVPSTNPGKKSGVLTLGRGNDFHVYILPKTQLNLKMGKRGRDAAKKHGETKGERLAGITEAFGTYRTVGKHKVTGTNEPYFIRLPQRAFKVHNLEVPAGSGKTIVTLMPYKKTNKKQQKAYGKFLEVYGYPKLANTKGDPVKFVIHKSTRGSYYDKLAKRIKKAKGGKKK